MGKPESSGEIGDINSLISHHSVILSRLQDRRDCIKAKRKLDGDIGMRVSDHAVIRYLQRVDGIDMANVRSKIRQLVREAEPLAKESAEAVQRFHSIGLVFIVSREGNVITILSEEQAKKFEGRRLKNGGRAERRKRKEQADG